MHNVWSLSFQNTASFASYVAKAIDWATQWIDNATQVAVAYWNGQNFASTTNFLAFFDTFEITKDYHTDFAWIQVKSQTQGAIGKC